MGEDQLISLDDYLRSNTGFNDRNLTIIREWYKQECGGSFPEPYDESALREVARHLKIKINTAECLELLSDCVFNSSVEDSRALAESSWKSRIIAQSVMTTNGSYTSLFSSASILTNINCSIKIKMSFLEVLTFIRSFLLQSLNVSTPVTTNIDQQSFILDGHCPYIY